MTKGEKKAFADGKRAGFAEAASDIDVLDGLAAARSDLLGIAGRIRAGFLSESEAAQEIEKLAGML